MRYRKLGRSGIDVSAYCLGTMMLGQIGNPDHDACIRIVAAALDAGINLVAMADMYSAGESETIVGKALRGRRDEIMLATKGHFPLEDGPNRSGNSRRWLTRAADDSLRRLDTGWIDLSRGSTKRPPPHCSAYPSARANHDDVFEAMQPRRSRVGLPQADPLRTTVRSVRHTGQSRSSVLSTPVVTNRRIARMPAGSAVGTTTGGPRQAERRLVYRRP